MRCVAVLIFCETSAWNAVSLLRFSPPQAIAPPLLSVNTHSPTHPHGTVSNSAASGSACVNREQQHFPNLSQAQTSSLPFPSIHLFLLCHTLSQSSPPCSGHCALILARPPSILVALSYHFGMSPSSSNPFALPSIPDVQHPYSCSLSLYYCQSSEACSQTLLFADLFICCSASPSHVCVIFSQWNKVTNRGTLHAAQPNWFSITDYLNLKQRKCWSKEKRKTKKKSNWKVTETLGRSKGNV